MKPSLPKLTNPNLFQPDKSSAFIPVQPQPPPALPIRCPHCRRLGSFQVAMHPGSFSYEKAIELPPPPSLPPPVPQRQPIPPHGSFTASIRVCPNPTCRGLVFVIDSGDSAAAILPPELLDFDGDHLPTGCLNTLKEAIACHGAGAYRAAAMMVRRLLEEICEDNKAKGTDLHKRLQSLRNTIVLPEALFEAMGELKALGNDAAHIEAKAYDSIGREEVADSIELAKEILKALYQLKGLVTRLQARRTP
jgi:hypothetical protein